MSGTPKSFSPGNIFLCSYMKTLYGDIEHDHEIKKESLEEEIVFHQKNNIHHYQDKYEVQNRII